MTEDLATYFKGTWKFEREIIFSGSGQHYAHAAGEAAFTPSLEEANELKYKEAGKVTIAQDTKASAFFRNYRYVFSTEGLDIFFQDELTQNFNLYQSYTYEKQSHSLIATDKHFCNKDVYEGNFLLNDPKHFIHTTLIKGPHKDYFITTHFNKIET